jgi:hypothetical protein
MAEPEENAVKLTLCPNCCTIDDILAHDSDPESIAPLAGCERCSFTFPLFPGKFALLTLEAMHMHICRVAGPEQNWTGVAEAISIRIRELGLSQDDLTRRLRNPDRYRPC